VCKVAEGIAYVGQPEHTQFQGLQGPHLQDVFFQHHVAVHAGDACGPDCVPGRAGDPNVHGSHVLPFAAKVVGVQGAAARPHRDDVPVPREEEGAGSTGRGHRDRVVRPVRGGCVGVSTEEGHPREVGYAVSDCGKLSREHRECIEHAGSRGVGQLGGGWSAEDRER